jgi:hypothetical protein
MYLGDYIRAIAGTFDRTAGMRSSAQQLLRRAPQELHDLAPIGFKIQGSGGAGVPATIPWFGFLDPDETSTPLEGLYVVYLFAKDLQSIYLTLIQGISRLHEEIRPPAAARARLREDGARIRAELSDERLRGYRYSIDLGDRRKLPAGYEAGAVAAVRYDVGNLPTEEALREDFRRMLEVYQDAIVAKRFLLTTQPGAISTPSGKRGAKPVDEMFDHFKPKSSDDYVAHVTGGRFERTRRHEALIRDYGKWIRGRRFEASTAQHPKDLVLRRSDSVEWLVEGKVIRRGNAASAVRQAIGQLLEYRRFLYVDLGKPPPRLVAVFTEPVGDAYVALLLELGIEAVWNVDGLWSGTQGAIEHGLAEMVLEPMRGLGDAEYSRSIQVDAQYIDEGHGRARLELTNKSTVTLHDLRFELPPEAGSSFFVHAELPVARLPAGKSVRFLALRTMGSGSSHFEIPITARTPDGSLVRTEAFVSLV